MTFHPQSVISTEQLCAVKRPAAEPTVVVREFIPSGFGACKTGATRLPARLCFHRLQLSLRSVGSTAVAWKRDAGVHGRLWR